MIHYNYLWSKWTFEEVACLSLGPKKIWATDSKFPSVKIWYSPLSILDLSK